jgi:hypothetical protein
MLRSGAVHPLPAPAGARTLTTVLTNSNAASMMPILAVGVGLVQEERGAIADMGARASALYVRVNA